MSRTYGDYLRLPELLSLQTRVSDGPEHDEMLFIVIHQVYELWFKQQLHEADHAHAQLMSGNDEGASATLRRMRTILKTMVAQIDVLETMTPVQFLSFRKFLDNASGFQSWQFRALEFSLGKKSGRFATMFADGTPERAALEARYQTPTLWDAFARHLETRGLNVPASVRDRDVTTPVTADPAMQAVLLDLYRRRSDLRSLCEILVDLDEGIQEWRYRHVKMVERTIGFKAGTGGPSGAEYLRTTLFQPMFPDLWAIRSSL
jgi:tryptophan 2,3-dioxygenase